jgi:hypothetical protein
VPSQHRQEEIIVKDKAMAVKGKFIWIRDI